MKTQYNVTFKSMLGLALVLSVISFLCIGSAILYNKPSFVIPGILLLVLLFVIRIRFKVLLDDKQIAYTGFFATKVIPFF